MVQKKNSLTGVLRFDELFDIEHEELIFAGIYT